LDTEGTVVMNYDTSPVDHLILSVSIVGMHIPLIQYV